MSYTALYTFTAPTGLAAALEAQLVNTSGANVGSAVTTGFVEVPAATGNYLWSGTVPTGHVGAVILRGVGGGTCYAVGGISPAELEAATPAQILLHPAWPIETDFINRVTVGNVTGDVDGDINGTLNGGVYGDVYGRVLGFRDDPGNFGFGGDNLGPGVWLDPADPNYPTGGGDPATIAAAVWAYLLSLPIPPGSVLAFLVAKLAAVGAASVTIQSALSLDGGTIHVVIGDSYEQTAAHRYAGEWADTGDQLAGLSITSVAWVTNTGLTKAITPTTVSGHLHFALELSRTDTGTFTDAQKVTWALVLTLNDGDLVTWRQGLLKPRARTP